MCFMMALVPVSLQVRIVLSAGYADGPISALRCNGPYDYVESPALPSGSSSLAHHVDLGSHRSSLFIPVRRVLARLIRHTRHYSQKRRWSIACIEPCLPCSKLWEQQLWSQLQMVEALHLVVTSECVCLLRSNSCCIQGGFFPEQMSIRIAEGNISRHSQRPLLPGSPGQVLVRFSCELQRACPMAPLQEGPNNPGCCGHKEPLP